MYLNITIPKSSPVNVIQLLLNFASKHGRECKDFEDSIRVSIPYRLLDKQLVRFLAKYIDKSEP